MEFQTIVRRSERIEVLIFFSRKQNKKVEEIGSKLTDIGARYRSVGVCIEDNSEIERDKRAATWKECGISNGNVSPSE